MFEHSKAALNTRLFKGIGNLILGIFIYIYSYTYIHTYIYRVYIYRVYIHIYREKDRGLLGFIKFLQGFIRFVGGILFIGVSTCRD